MTEEDVSQRALATAWDRRVTWVLLVVGIVVVTTLTQHGPGLANDTSRLATADALVNTGSFAIDGTYFEYTADRIKVDGRFYSDKPPLLSIYLAVIFYLLNGLFGWTMSGELSSVYYWMTLLSSGLAYLATLLGVRRLASDFGVGAIRAGLIALAAGFGTLLLPYSVVISSHAIAAPFLVWFGVLLFRHLPDRTEGMSPLVAIGAGVLGGVGTLIEPLVAVFVVPMTLAFCSRESRRSAFPWLVLGGSLPLIPHAIVTYGIAGNPFLLNLNPEYFAYTGSMHDEGNLSGIGWAHDSLGETLTYAYHSLIGYRGAILYNMPAALGSGFAVYVFFREAGRRLIAGILVGVGLFLFLTIGFTSNYSGFAYGIRWHAAPAPLLTALIGAASVEGEAVLRRVATRALVATAVIATPIAALGTIDPWTPSTQEEYSVVEVLSGEDAYVKEHLDAAVVHLREGRNFEARFQAEHAIRREDRIPVAWEVAVRASARIGDRERLATYRRRLAAGEGPEKRRHREVLIGQIDRLLAGSRGG